MLVTETRAKQIELPPHLDFKYREKPVYSFFKRIFDIVLSAFALIVLSPVLLVCIAAIFIKDPGNPFFEQDRVGKNGKFFKIYKLRSMYKDAEERKAELAIQEEAENAVGGDE